MSITVTDSAAKHIKAYAGEPRLRVAVTVDGCSGFTYKADMITRILDSDYVYESNGITVVIDTHSIPFLDGTEIDYVKEGLNTGFKYNNPNASNTCGCGTSFNIQEK